MPEYRTEPLVVPAISGLLPEGERNRRVALTSFSAGTSRVQVPTRDVVCYECGRRSHVPAAALSAQCIHCHAHLNMADVELRAGSRRLTVRTLGDVTVAADAVLSHLSIVCRNLTLHGRASGSFRCMGTLRVGASCRVEGSVQAAALEVEKGVDVVFVQGARVGTASLRGCVSGRLDCRGKVCIHRGGVLYGDCAASAVELEPGAVHRGRREASAAS